MSKTNKLKKVLPTSFRLSVKGEQLLELLAQDLGLSKTGVVEIAIREAAKSRGLSLPSIQGNEE